MPEGDTIHKLARYLSPRLRGKELIHYRPSGSPRAIVVDDDSVDLVFARGKHLLITLTSGRCLRVHLGMHGTFHHYTHDARWKRSPRTAHLIFATKDSVFVCFKATKIELSRQQHLVTPSAVKALGPDLIDSLPSLTELQNRVQARRHISPRLDDLLLDQHVAAGIGNVYKSELLFIHRRHPSTLVEEVPIQELFAIYQSASDLLKVNLNGGPRITTLYSLPDLNPQGSHLWVYGRHKSECFRCPTPIRRAFSGRQSRVTYWCPSCQPTLSRRAAIGIS